MYADRLRLLWRICGHRVRHSLRSVPWKGGKTVVADLKRICPSVTEPKVLKEGRYQ